MGELDILVEDVKKSLTRMAKRTVAFTAHTRRATVHVTRDGF